MPASLDILFSIMNSTLQTFNGTEDVAALESFLILPEVVNLFFLSGGVYGMYQGIQVRFTTVCSGPSVTNTLRA